jgi:hypothetical protein
MTLPMPETGPASWRQLLADQNDVISRVQARRGGLSEDQWQWRLDTGRWQSVLHGVAVAHSGEVTDRQRAWAAVLYAGEGARLSADAALIELGMRLPTPREIHVVSSREVAPQVFAHAPNEDGVRLRSHRAQRLTEWAHPVRQPPLLRLPVAALHAAAWASSDRAAEWRLAAVVQQRLARVTDLRAPLEQIPRLPRRALVREVLDDIEFGAHAASELDFLRFLRLHRLPMPDRLQRPVRAGKLRYLDAWWETQRVNAEMDGAHHRTVGSWDDDALRGNDVVLVERHDRILLLRFTRGNLRHDGERVAAQLREALLP